MRRLVIGLLLSSLYIFAAFSQSPEQPVARALEKQDTLAILALISQAESVRFQNIDSSLYYARIAKQLADSIGYLRGAAKALAWIGYGYDNQGKHFLAVEHLSTP